MTVLRRSDSVRSRRSSSEENQAKNVGWRIDYQIGSAGLSGTARSAEIYRDERFSDHAPLSMDYALG